MQVQRGLEKNSNKLRKKIMAMYVGSEGTGHSTKMNKCDASGKSI